MRALLFCIGLLLFASSGSHAETLRWAPSATAANCLSGSNLGGTGTWNLVTANWCNSSNQKVAWTAGSEAVFSVTGGLVTVSGTAPTFTPNDGLRNGSEGGLGSVTVSLTDCGGSVFNQTVTDASGAWVLGIPSAQVGQPVCVGPALPTGYVATGANAAGTVTPDGSPTLVGAVTYTYGRSANRTAFTAPANGLVVLNFAQVPVSRLDAAGARAGAPGSHVVYPHQFVAGTGGSLQISTGAGTSAPANSGWREVVYLDPSCTGTLQPGATLLYPPATAPMTVVQGQAVCFVVQQFVVGSATVGATRTLPVLAQLTFANAVGLSASFTVDDITTASTSGQLQLLKEVRTVGSMTWGTSNAAKRGQQLEYRVTMANHGVSAINSVTVTDATPAYTTFTSATVGTLPAALGTCVKTTPANAAAVACTDVQSVGGTGVIRWTFSGPLNPGASAELFYVVEVK